MKVTIFASVEAVVAAKLSETAARKRVPQSAIVAWAIQHFLAEHKDAVIVTVPGGNKANRDGKDEAARAIIKADPHGTIREIQRAMEDAGIKRGTGWISNARSDIKGAVTTLTS